MARKSGLGRGLTSLIPAGAGEDPDAVAAGLSEVPIESIRPNPSQPRRAFDEESLEGLSDSIKELGVLQPVQPVFQPAARPSRSLVTLLQ